MNTSMATAQSQKQEIPHLRLVTPERTPEQLLDLELVEEIVRLDVGEAHVRPRRFHKIAAGELHPLRVLARLVNDALHADVDPRALWHALVRPITRLIERKYRRRLPPKREGKYLPAS